MCEKFLLEQITLGNIILKNIFCKHPSVEYFYTETLSKRIQVLGLNYPNLKNVLKSEFTIKELKFDIDVKKFDTSSRSIKIPYEGDSDLLDIRWHGFDLVTFGEVEKVDSAIIVKLFPDKTDCIEIVLDYLDKHVEVINNTVKEWNRNLESKINILLNEYKRNS